MINSRSIWIWRLQFRAGLSKLVQEVGWSGLLSSSAAAHLLGPSILIKVNNKEIHPTDRGPTNSNCLIYARLHICTKFGQLLNHLSRTDKPRTSWTLFRMGWTRRLSSFHKLGILDDFESHEYWNCCISVKEASILLPSIKLHDLYKKNQKRVQNHSLGTFCKPLKNAVRFKLNLTFKNHHFLLADCQPAFIKYFGKRFDIPQQPHMFDPRPRLRCWKRPK